jgi:tetratricopeptide (TPR) repeat protein
MQTIRAWWFAQLATIALLFRRPQAAIDYYKLVLRERPADALTVSRIGFIHAETGNHEQAIAEFERAVELDPGVADNWFNLGYLRQQQQGHAGAVEAFDRALACNDSHDRAWYGKALSLIAQGQHADAIAPLKRNVQLQPMSPYGHMALARAYWSLGDVERCEKRMHRLKSFDPKNAAVLEDETGIRIGIDRWWKN